MTQLLDHGYLEVVRTWGSDEEIVSAARMSTDGAFRGWGCSTCNGTKKTRVCEGHGDWDTIECPDCTSSSKHPGDERLLRYLWTNNHHTPFEMCGVTFEVQAPIFVFRQWHRHRTFSYNELSARYTEMPDLYYTPAQFKMQSTSNKQGSSVQIDDPYAATTTYNVLIAQARFTYDKLLSLGVSREQARGVLPVCQYSRMRVSGNLRNWLHFLDLRCDPHAQEEIRVYADCIRTHLVDAFPRTMELYNE